jgi:hypothetical protein
VPFLGHVLSDGRIMVDPTKVQEVMDWKALDSVHEVRSFLGLAGYYRHFIPDFSKIAKPMTRLLQKDMRFVWTPECDVAFHKLRTLLTSTPVLAPPDIEKPFDVYCDCIRHRFGRCSYVAVLPYITISYTLKSKIIELQKTDTSIFHIKRKMKEQEIKHFRVDEDGVLWFKDRLIMPKDQELRNQIMSKAHLSKLSIHLGSTKMYHDLKPHYWWTKMRKEIVAYVARCDTCCRVKAMHMKARLLQPLSILGWKWEEISMDFIVGLPPTIKNHNSIWVIVDHLTKSAHFISVRADYHPTNYAELYFN